MSAPRGSGGAGASEAEVRAAYAAWVLRNGSRRISDVTIRAMLDAAAAARPAPAGEASEVERLRAQRDAAQLDAILWTGRAEMQEERASDAESRERDALAMILFVGLCGGDRIAKLEADNARLRALLTPTSEGDRHGRP